MLQKIKNKTGLLIFTLSLWANITFAQLDDPGGNGYDPGDEPVKASIHDWIPFVILIMIAIVFYYMHKKKVIVKS